jgi:energy-coupling factor transporter transmembrane protein EcfT
LLVVAAAARLPLLRILMLSLYAAVFAALYGISLRHVDFAVYGLVLLKAVTPALAVLMLIVSTPYPRLFSLTSAVLPELPAAGLFMTYRSFFILLDMMNNFIVALRFRAGLARGRIVKTIANIPRVIAMLLVAAVERSSRLYAVMAVRGYSGSMAEKERARLTRHDWLPLAAGGAVLMFVILWK